MSRSPTLPVDPFSLLRSAGFEPSATRTVAVCGVDCEVLWLPERAARRGVPGERRPPFRPCSANRILEHETSWSDDDHALTPNRFPFGRRHALLWSRRPLREPDRALLETAFSWATAADATVIGNSIGAAASIARAHLHLLGERLPFLANQRAAPLPDGNPIPDLLHDVEVGHLPGFPALVLSLRGSAAARAAAVERLLLERTAPAFNLVADPDSTWLMPRGRVEITPPHFPQALGGAEFWGRWCFLERTPFEMATTAGLESALADSGYPSGLT